MSVYAIPKEETGLADSFKLLSKGLCPLWFKGPLPTPNSHAKKARLNDYSESDSTIQNVELNNKDVLCIAPPPWCFGGALVLHRRILKYTS